MGHGPRITKGDSERGINNMGESENGLKRQIGLFGAVAILVGAVIGSGIFMTPGTVAASAKSFGPFMVAWILAGASGILCSFGCHACNWICKQSCKADTGNYSCRN